MAATWRPRRSSTRVRPASLRAITAPSTAAATPATRSGTPSSKALAAGAKDILHVPRGELVQERARRPAELKVRQPQAPLALRPPGGRPVNASALTTPTPARRNARRP